MGNKSLSSDCFLAGYKRVCLTAACQELNIIEALRPSGCRPLRSVTSYLILLAANVCFFGSDLVIRIFVGDECIFYRPAPVIGELESACLYRAIGLKSFYRFGGDSVIAFGHTKRAAKWQARYKNMRLSVASIT